MTNRISRITTLLSILNPSALEIIDESQMHRGHAGVDSTQEETHLRIKIAADFGEVNTLEKHRIINDIVKDEFKRGLHALSIEVVNVIARRAKPDAAIPL